MFTSTSRTRALSRKALWRRADLGDHPFTVPLGVTSVYVVAVRGHGGSAFANGGLRAMVQSAVRVAPGSTIYAEVGGNGAPG